MLRLSRRLNLQMAFGLATAAVLLLAIGYALGCWHGGAQRDVARSTAFLAQVAELNDVTLLRQYCERNYFNANGRRACTLPSIWIDASSR